MAASSQTPFEMNNFTGGITDNAFGQNYTKSSELDNFILNPNGEPVSRPGSEIDNETESPIPAGNERIGTLINYANNDKLFVHSIKKFYYRNPSAYATLTGPTGNDVLSLGTDANVLSFTQWNRHLFVTSDAYPRPQKIYKDSGGAYRVRTSGLPMLATAPVVTAGAAGARSYVYAFHYEYTYTAGPQTFQDFGAVTFVTLNNSGDPSINPNPISAIPVISNGATDNWDTTVIKVFIYRTIDGGTTFYKIGEVTNGTLIFSDNNSDASIQDNLVLYTDDGTLDFDPVPLSKFVHIVNSIGYYGAIKEGSEEFPFRIRQSIPGDPDSTPSAFFKDLEDDIQGVSSIKSIPLVFCKRHVYRLENSFDQFGRGDINAVRISDTAGCVSNLSIVQAENWCFWAGNDGFYATDGYQVMKISDGNNNRYRDILEEQAQNNFIYGKFDELRRRVYWGLQRDAGSLDNDSLAVLDLRWGVKEDSVFTTWSGDSFRPTSLEFFNGLLYRGDTRGFVFFHDDGLVSDPKIDINESAEDWFTETIIWTYDSIHINFGSTFFRKMPTKMLLTCVNEGNTTIQITAFNDDLRFTRNLKIIRARDLFTWGDDLFVWGSDLCTWHSVGLIEQWRRFPARGLRTSYIKIRITNGYGVISSSDFFGTATPNNATNTVVLDNLVDNMWPQDVVDYFISFEDDDYVRQYQITERTSNSTLTVLDALNTLPIIPQNWLIKGFRRGEPLHILSYNIAWSNVSQTQATFESGNDGANSA